MQKNCAHADATWHTYTAFGLIIASEVPLPELVESAAAEPDVIIRLGKVPADIEQAIIVNANRTVGKGRFRLNNPGIAKFYVENGNCIIIEPYPGAQIEQIQLFLLGSCMGAVLFQRGILPLHGSCLEVAGQGVLLTGISGAGKSTIGAALLAKGCGLVTDDVAAVTFLANGSPVVQPSYPGQKLWEDALARSHHQAEIRSLNRVANDLNKYAVAKPESFYRQPVRLCRIYEIVPAATDKLQFEEMTGTDKLGVIIKNTYRRFLVKGFDCKEWHFRYCAAIAGQLSVCRIQRPQGKHLEQEIAQTIIEQMSC